MVEISSLDQGGPRSIPMQLPYQKIPVTTLPLVLKEFHSAGLYAFPEVPVPVETPSGGNRLHPHNPGLKDSKERSRLKRSKTGIFSMKTNLAGRRKAA